jgi:hypothetical protein
MRWVVRVLERDRPEVRAARTAAVCQQPPLAFRIDRESKDPVRDRARESEGDRVVVSRTQLGGFAQEVLQSALNSLDSTS